MKETLRVRLLALLTFAAILCLCCAGAFAAGTTMNVSALMDFGMTIKYNGHDQAFTDVNGKAVYPLVYEGTTYLPVRAVAGLFDTAVDWDGASKTVYLGSKETAPVPVTADMVDPQIKAHFSQNPAELVMDGVAHSSGLVNDELDSASIFYGGADIHLGGKYTTFSCWVYYPASNSSNSGCSISFQNKANEASMKKVSLTPGAPAQYIEFSVSGVNDLKIKPDYSGPIMGCGDTYIIADMMVK